MKSRGPCGWCLTGNCCTAIGSLAVGFVGCTHCRRCDGHIAPIDEEELDMPSIIQRIWKQLDDELDEIIDITNQRALAETHDVDPGVEDLDLALATAKGRARGKAEALALMMTPHFTTADEISTEASKRKWYRDNGQEYRTPGLAGGTLGVDLQARELERKALES